MNLLGTEAYRNALADGLNNTKSSILILSAFITQAGFNWIIEKIRSNNINGKIIVRWRLDDLLYGYSDIELYNTAKKYNWSLFVYPDLHAKSILIDESLVYVGSANITGKGLSVVPGANRELGVYFTASKQDIAVYNNILSESTFITDDIYVKIHQFLSIQQKKFTNIQRSYWPKEIKNILQKPPQKLWVADMLWSNPQNIFNIDELNESDKKSVLHDIRILGLMNEELSDENKIKKAFMNSRPWKWFYNQLTNSKNKELYFGMVSEILHNSLLDDPKPYRKDVKDLVQNLYSWVTFLKSDKIVIDVPGKKSQRIKVL